MIGRMQRWFACIFVLVFIMMALSVNVIAAEAPSFEGLTVGTPSNNSNSTAEVEFSENVYSSSTSKTKLSTDSLNVSIQGGTASLISYSVSQNSKRRASISLELNGIADGSELLLVRPAGPDTVFNADGIAMSPDEQIVCNLNDETPPEFAAGYPTGENFAVDSFDLKIRSNEEGTAYYVVIPDGHIVPSALYVSYGWAWNGNSWGPLGNDRKGSVNLNANTEAGVTIYSLEAGNAYDVYVIIEDCSGNHSEVMRVDITIPGELSGDCSLLDLQIAENTIDNFNPEILEYNLELPEGNAEIPQVTAVPNDAGATMVINQALAIPGMATIIVTAEDGTSTRTYTVNFLVEESDDASLYDLQVQDVTITGFSSDILSYVVELPYGSELSDTSINAIASYSGATVIINQAMALPGSATVIVTAENEQTQVCYTINFSVAANTAGEILGFSFEGLNPIVEASITGNDVSLLVPWGTNLSSLVPTIIVSDNAEIYPVSGVMNDFSNPVTYTVIAEDRTETEWVVQVSTELDNISNLLLIGKHLFQMDDTNGFNYENVLAAIASANNIYYKSSNGRWYDLNTVNQSADLADESLALPATFQNNIIIEKWYKTGNTIQEF